MPRVGGVQSGTGIYHAMLRDINRQDQDIVRVVMFFLLMLMVACHRSPSEPTFQVEVTNKVLYQEILAYHDSILQSENAKELAKGDSVYVWVYFKELNDSMKRYAMEYIYDLEILDIFPAEFVCMVGGHPVFFSAAGGNSQYDFKHPYFGIPPQLNDALLKHYFPTKYEEKLRQRKQMEETGYASVASRISHPTIYFLTFLRDSLIDKQYGKGTPRDRVIITMNGEDVWL